MQQDRRQYCRLPLKLSVSCQKAGASDGKPYSGSTINVSPGGMLIELGTSDFTMGQILCLEVAVPPAEGLLEFGGRLSSYARVVRLYPDAAGTQARERACSLAVEFCQPPKFQI